MDMIAPIASEVPYMTLPGNHEYYPYDYGVEGYLTHFHMPSESSPSTASSSYSEWAGSLVRRAWSSLFLPRREYPVDPALSTPPMGFSVYSKVPSPSPSPEEDEGEGEQEKREDNEKEREKERRHERKRDLEKPHEEGFKKEKEQEHQNEDGFRKEQESEQELEQKPLEFELEQQQEQSQQENQPEPNQQLHQPTPDSPIREGVFYSFDYSFVHFIALSSEESLSPSSPQMVWLEGDLEETERRKEKGECLWTVLMVHRPMYRFVWEPVWGGRGECPFFCVSFFSPFPLSNPLFSPSSARQCPSKKEFWATKEVI